MPTTVYSVTTEAEKTTTVSAAGKEHAGRFYPQLNGLRFVFIFLVLLQHWGSQTFFEKYRWGWLGVDLFFVLSGFLIGEILLLENEKSVNKLQSIRNFIIRRALRIFPLYYITIVLYAGLFTTGGILIYNLTYTNNILQAFYLERVKEEFWHIWSLCVEEQFYIIFPFMLFFLSKKNLKKVLIGGIILSVAGRFVTVFITSQSDPHVLMPFCLDSLFLGVLMAYFKVYHPSRLQSFFTNKFFVAAIIFACLAGLWLVCFINNELLVFTLLRLLGSIAGFMIIGYSVMKRFGGLMQTFLENPMISFFGKISYGIYLIHPFVERVYYQHADNNVVRNFFINLHLPVLSNRYIIDFVFLFTMTIALSYLSFEFIEKRFLKLKTLYS